MSTTGRDVLDFIEHLRTLQDCPAVMTALESKLRGFGFNSFLITGLPVVGDRLSPHVLLNAWPPGWIEFYDRQGFVDVDPIAARSRETYEPFAWSEVAPHQKRSVEVMHRARDFSMTQGFCIPIHNEDGFLAAVTMAGEQPDMSDETRSALHLTGIYAHSQVTSILRKELSFTRRRLSVREREVLTWMALGYTAEEVGDKLSLMRTTVVTHYQNAARKLSTRGRVPTVLEAHRRGEIIL